MTTNSKFVVNIFTDSGYEYGIGHYIRCKEIEKALIVNNIKVNFIRHTKNYNYNTKDKCDLSFIDLPYDMTPYIKFWKNKEVKVVTLEYYNEIINPSLNISVLDFPFSTGSKENQFHGLEFIIIRSEIRELANAVSGGYGLIMLGGSVEVDNIISLVKLFSNSIKIKVIVGPYTKLNNIDIANRHIQFLKNPKNLPALMSQCDWCITNGGISMLEMIYLKKNIFVIPQTKLEEKLSSIMGEHGLIDFFSESSIEYIKKKKFLNKKKNKIFDGNGSIKIADLILDELSIE